MGGKQRSSRQWRLFHSAKHTFKLEGSPLDFAKPTPEQMSKLQTAFLMVKDAGSPMPPPPADLYMPSLVSQIAMWHFPKSKAEALKTTFSREVQDGWISTYDAVMAPLWSSMTRAKLDMLKPDLESTTKLAHAVDARKVWDPPLLLAIWAVA
ncbi:hypothetical protein DL95DRAFT_493455 [Leptodontidium sp. 2 PMI_412]|nr:hypothetical protein DL95DRAFT_493455 [Leptodontidium sp. 2 PMI_412]